MNDPVNKPKHYTSHPSGVECIEVTARLDFCLGNAFKYFFRSENKGKPEEDLKKCLWYLDAEVNLRHAGEVWKPIPSVPKYECSTEGRIRHIETKRIRKLQKIKGGYLTFVYSLGGKHHLSYVHRVVAETFLGNPNNLPVVCHVDGVKTNNRFLNLRFDTQKGNIRDTQKHGTANIGENNPSAKLSQATADIIRENPDNLSRAELAKKYNVSKSQIDRIHWGENWNKTANPLPLNEIIEKEPKLLDKQFYSLFRDIERGEKDITNLLACREVVLRKLEDFTPCQ